MASVSLHQVRFLSYVSLKKSYLVNFLLCDLVFGFVILRYETKLRLLPSLVYPNRVSVRLLHTICGA